MSEPSAIPPAPVPAGPMGLEPAEFGPRAIAIIIDGVILGIVNAILSRVPVIGFILPLAVGIAYFVYFWSFDNPVGLKGQTIGKKVMNIKVVLDDGSDLDPVKALIRYVGYFVSSIIIGIGFLFPLWRPDKKALHDLIAGTRVVKVQ